MDRTSSTHVQNNKVERQLAHLKILSRLLGHELHAQTSPRITLSRDEVMEIQASLDMYIEDVMRTKGYGGASSAASGNRTQSDLEVQAVPTRVN